MARQTNNPENRVEKDLETVERILAKWGPKFGPNYETNKDFLQARRDLYAALVKKYQNKPTSNAEQADLKLANARQRADNRLLNNAVFRLVRNALALSWNLLKFAGKLTNTVLQIANQSLTWAMGGSIKNRFREQPSSNQTAQPNSNSQEKNAGTEQENENRNQSTNKAENNSQRRKSNITKSISIDALRANREQQQGKLKGVASIAATKPASMQRVNGSKQSLVRKMPAYQKAKSVAPAASTGVKR